MACNPDFVQYIIDQCSGAGEIAVKKMMGDYCAYCDGVLFGLICDNNIRFCRCDTGLVLRNASFRGYVDSSSDNLKYYK